MNITSITKILFFFFFLLAGIEHINASSSNLRKRKTTVITTPLIDTISSIFTKEDWSCCDGTNEPTPVPTSRSTSPTFSSVTSTPIPIPTTRPTYSEKKLTASDGSAQEDLFGTSCSMSGDMIVIGAFLSGENNEGAAYLYNLNGNEIKKFTPDDYGEEDEWFGYSISMDEKIVLGTLLNNYVSLFSLEGDYERNVTCDECYFFGHALGTYRERIVISGFDSSNKLFIYTTEGEFLKAINNGIDGDDFIDDVDISDEVIVFTTRLNTLVYSNSAPDFEFIVEIPQGGKKVATSGDRLVIGDYKTNNYDGTVWLYETDGTFIKTLDRQDASSGWFGRSVDVTDGKIIVGADGDDELGTNAGSVFIYSVATGDFQEHQMVMITIGLVVV